MNEIKYRRPDEMDASQKFPERISMRQITEYRPADTLRIERLGGELNPGDIITCSSGPTLRVCEETQPEAKNDHIWRALRAPAGG